MAIHFIKLLFVWHNDLMRLDSVFMFGLSMFFLALCCLPLFYVYGLLRLFQSLAMTAVRLWVCCVVWFVALLVFIPLPFVLFLDSVFCLLCGFYLLVFVV